MTYVSKLIVLLLGVVMISNIVTVHAVPTELSKSVGIVLSKNCVIMLKQHYETDCPSYEPLMLMNLDTSDKKITGDFSFINGIYQRENPVLKNHYRYYDYDKSFNIFVDPPSDMRDKIKMITIESHFDKYLLPAQMIKINDTRTYSQDRYVDSKCREAVIGADDWQRLLSDTIYYMRNNCGEQFTSFKPIVTVQDNVTEQDITTSMKYRQEQYLKWIRENCLVSYGSCNPETNPWK